jgi:iron complex transport system permease protein
MIKLNKTSPAGSISGSESYQKYTGRKKAVLLILSLLIIIFVLLSINAGAASLDPGAVFDAMLRRGDSTAEVVIWNIRLPRIVAGIVAGTGLAIAGCVMQNTLRNPLASPITLGTANAAAFGANVAIILLGAGSIQSTASDAVIINNPYMVTISAFLGSMTAAMLIIMLARFRNFTPEAMVLAGVALGSLFSAGTILIQYFAQDVQVAAVIFWTFGDLGRASWKEVAIMFILTALAMIYFMYRRWDYNALDSGEETARGLGVNVERVRLEGMFISSLITAAAVSFLGIIGFVGLVAPQMMRRVIGSDHRFLIPAAALAGSVLLLFSDTLARTVISPIVLPVGAITSFMGAPLFIYLLARGYSRI